MHTAAFGARTNLLSPLPALPLPLSHPPPKNAIRGAGLRLFPPPPPHTPEDCDQFLATSAKIEDGLHLGAWKCCRNSDNLQKFWQVVPVQQAVQYGRDAAHKSRAAWAFRSLEVYMHARRHHLNESSSARLGGSQQLGILPSPNSKQAQDLSA